MGEDFVFKMIFYFIAINFRSSKQEEAQISPAGLNST